MSAQGITSSHFEPSGEITHPLVAPKLNLPHPIVMESSHHPIEGYELKHELLDFVKDEQWMTFVQELFTAASNICSLMTETRAAEMVPYLNIISSPITLYHAVKESVSRLKLVVAACKTGRVAEFFFWSLGAVSSIASAAGNIIKPVSSGVVLAGLTGIVAVKTTFSLIIPSVLIAFSAIGAIHENWSLIKTELAHHEFTLKKKAIFSLNEMEELLRELKGPSHENLSEHAFQLEKKEFESCHFTSEKRRKAVQKRVHSFFSRIGSAQLVKARTALDALLPLLQQKELTFESILNDYENAIGHLQGLGVDLGPLIQSRDELKELMAEGVQILDTVDSELHRQILQKHISILSFYISFLAALLFILVPTSQTLPTVLSLTSTSIGAFNIIFDKSVSQKQFLKLARFFGRVDYNSSS